MLTRKKDDGYNTSKLIEADRESSHRHTVVYTGRNDDGDDHDRDNDHDEHNESNTQDNSYKTRHVTDLKIPYVPTLRYKNG